MDRIVISGELEKDPILIASLMMLFPECEIQILSENIGNSERCSGHDRVFNGQEKEKENADKMPVNQKTTYKEG